ncbi:MULTISPECIES: NUDIX domain-containing protein [Thiomicrorhabdus]|uniref:NUDIX domain-containing protein n=1 Tax=Thiomicrorhabdus heinhorstiae TaxID=2748010 RepID=A0ABS0BYC4_9GAMM|nr:MULTISPECIES: NUDIX domain-containing protein [Thiomicrorhabdus]MBF6057077.1 NUDIX domain-containing protein [Thiomicrorhabdus heinhorstiae]
MQTVRMKNTAKGILLQDEKVLFLRKEYSDGRVVYTLPGGTQEAGEPLEETAIREVWEEVGARVKVLSLQKVYEHQRPSKSDPEMVKYKVEFAFLCELLESYVPHNGIHPDPSQAGVEWLALAELDNKVLDPLPLAEILQEILQDSGSCYHNLTA